MLHACVARFDVMFWGKNFWELNTLLMYNKGTQEANENVIIVPSISEHLEGSLANENVIIVHQSQSILKDLSKAHSLNHH
jgi:hypothetical protein